MYVSWIPDDKNGLLRDCDEEEKAVSWKDEHFQVFLMHKTDDYKVVDHMESLFDSELDCPLGFYVETTEAQSSGFDVDDCIVSSAVFLGTQRKIKLPELEMEEESGTKCKRFKSIPPTQPCLFVSVPENSSPLGLTLRKTPSFLELVDSKLSHSDASFSMLKKIKSTGSGASVLQSNGKTKASNFSASFLRIGSWERVSRYDGELVAKCYFAKRKLVWEVLDGGLKRKIEVQWSDIAALKATCENNAWQTLEIELLKQPLFFRETNPQPRKHTLWKATPDFTDGQSSIFRRHFLQFPPGTMRKHFEKLLQLDDRLSSLSKKPYPSLDSAFFDPDISESRKINDHMLLGLEGQSSIISKRFLKSGLSDDYSELLQCFTVRTTGSHNYSNLNQKVNASRILSHSLGTNPSCLNIFPSVVVSLPSLIPGLDTPNESYDNVDMTVGEVKTDLLGNLGAHSTVDFEPSCWISEIQTNQIVDSFKDFDHGDYVKFSANISGNTSFPVFVLEDDTATSSDFGEAVVDLMYMNNNNVNMK